jgi:hypothetical protein
MFKKWFGGGSSNSKKKTEGDVSSGAAVGRHPRVASINLEMDIPSNNLMRQINSI